MNYVFKSVRMRFDLKYDSVARQRNLCDDVTGVLASRDLPSRIPSLAPTRERNLNLNEPLVQRWWACNFPSRQVRNSSN